MKGQACGWACSRFLLSLSCAWTKLRVAQAQQSIHGAPYFKRSPGPKVSFLSPVYCFYLRSLLRFYKKFSVFMPVTGRWG